MGHLFGVLRSQTYIFARLDRALNTQHSTLVIKHRRALEEKTAVRTHSRHAARPSRYFNPLRDILRFLVPLSPQTSVDPSFSPVSPAFRIFPAPTPAAVNRHVRASAAKEKKSRRQAVWIACTCHFFFCYSQKKTHHTGLLPLCARASSYFQPSFTHMAVACSTSPPPYQGRLVPPPALAPPQVITSSPTAATQADCPALRAT